MTEYPKLEFRCSHELDEHIFQLLSQRQFQELEITKSKLLKQAVLLGLQIIKSNPHITQHISEQDFLKGDNSK